MSTPVRSPSVSSPISSSHNLRQTLVRPRARVSARAFFSESLPHLYRCCNPKINSRPLLATMVSLASHVTDANSLTAAPLQSPGKFLHHSHWFWTGLYVPWLLEFDSFLTGIDQIASKVNNSSTPLKFNLMWTACRIGEVKRVTKETNVHVKINLDGSGISESSTGIPFLDHMLDVSVPISSDTHVYISWLIVLI